MPKIRAIGRGVSNNRRLWHVLGMLYTIFDEKRVKFSRFALFPRTVVRNVPRRLALKNYAASWRIVSLGWISHHVRSHNLPQLRS